MTDVETSPIRPPDEVTPADWWSPQSLMIGDDLPYEEWEAMGTFVQATAAASPWWLGDWALYGEEKYGDSFYQAIDPSLFDKSHFSRCQFVAGIFPPDLRIGNVSWEHHSVVASKVEGSDADRAEWLQVVVEELASPGDLARRIREAQALDAPSSEGDEGKPEKVHPKDPPTYSNVRMSFRIDASQQRIAESLIDSLAAVVNQGLAEAGCDVSKTETAVSH